MGEAYRLTGYGINFALKGQWIKTTTSQFCTALSGRLFDGTITHRVAVGCYALPLKGRRKKNLPFYRDSRRSHWFGFWLFCQVEY
jgi:ribosome modulation factor